MTDKEFSLAQQTERRRIQRTFLRGIKRTFTDMTAASIFVAAVVLLGCLIWYWCSRPHSINLTPFTTPCYVLIGIMLLCLVVYALGVIPRAREMRNNLARIGFTTHVGEPPEITDYRQLNERLLQITFNSLGLRASDWLDLKLAIESALNLILLRVEDGANMREVIVVAVPPIGKVPEKIMWCHELMNADKYTLALGESQAGIVEINLLKTPHWLIGAATGIGKTQLLLLIISQCIQKGMQLVVADWKKGIDFSADMQSVCRFVSDYTNLLSALKELERVIYRRMEMYNSVQLMRGSQACNNTETYYRLTGVQLQHYVFVVDEASMMLDATGRSKEEKAIIAEVIEQINTIGRLGRAFGVHLIICTQRPDVNSVPGSIKANLDGRIAGHTADNTASIVILDNADAAKLPAVPGRFIIRDGIGIQQVFQAYLL